MTCSSTPSKKTPGGAGTHIGHTRDTRDTRAHAGTRITRTNLTTIHPNPTTQTRTKTARITRTNLTTIHPNPTRQTRTKTATDSTAARTAASPESTAPRVTGTALDPEKVLQCFASNHKSENTAVCVEVYRYRFFLPGPSRWVGLVLRLVCEVLVSVSCVSRLPPVSLNRFFLEQARGGALGAGGGRVGFAGGGLF